MLMEMPTAKNMNHKDTHQMEHNGYLLGGIGKIEIQIGVLNNVYMLRQKKAFETNTT